MTFFFFYFLLFYGVLYKINLFLFLELFLISAVNTDIIRCPDVGTFPMREIWISRAEISIRVAVHPFGSYFNAVDIIKFSTPPTFALYTFAWERPCDGGTTMFFLETKLKRTPKVFCIEIICQ